VEVKVIDLALLQSVEELKEKEAVEVLVPGQTEVVLEAVESSVDLKVETVVVELIPPEYQVVPLSLVEVALLDQ
tara:strand:- start:385 stop:606 length:222 start_codon:yes stop_codon:yes gene_type:complete